MRQLQAQPGGITREATREMMTGFLKEKMRMKVPGGIDDSRIDAMAEAITSGDMMGVLRAALGGLTGG